MKNPTIPGQSRRRAPPLGALVGNLPGPVGASRRRKISGKRAGIYGRRARSKYRRWRNTIRWGIGTQKVNGIMAKKAAAKKPAKGGAKKLTKSGLIGAIQESVGDAVSKSQVKAVIEALVEVGQKELKKAKVFVLPGFAKFVVAEKPGRPAGEYLNHFT